MLTSELAVLTSLLAASHAAAIDRTHRAPEPRNADVINSLKLYRSSIDKHSSSKYLRSQLATSNGSGQAPLLATGSSFLTDVTIGGQNFTQLVDTGSSDTWVASSNFVCLDPLPPYQQVSQAACGLNTTLQLDRSFQPIPNENFNVSYGGGEFLNGIYGYDTVTFAGLTIPQQEIAVATLAGFDGDGSFSGIVGLAYPGLTGAFPGANASADVPCRFGSNATCSQIQYSTIMNTIFNVANLTQPFFTLALSRDTSATSNGGLLTIGQLPSSSDPSINITSSSTYATTPIEILHLDNRYRYYTISVDSLSYPNASATAGTGQWIVDSGTTLIYAPAAVAASINNQFEPPAVFNSTLEAWVVDCQSQTVPSLGVTIANQTFPINPADLVVDVGETPGELCVSGVGIGNSQGPGGLILGEVFLKNVLAVFDWGNVEMGFYEREYYES